MTRSVYRFGGGITDGEAGNKNLLGGKGANLARLNAERLYFQLAGTVMKLSPGQPQDVLDVQQEVRAQARELEAANARSETP